MFIYHITYKLHLNKNVLELMYDAKPTSDSVLSLTNHSYFCLGEDNIEDTKLLIPSLIRHMPIEMTNQLKQLKKCSMQY